MVKKTIQVWDPVVRLGHWVLVIAFFTAYFTEEDFLQTHVVAGYVVAGVVGFRLLWGFIGTRHARFKDFIYSPFAIFGYLKELAFRHPKHYIGHNPAGGAMVIALLISLTCTTLTGMKLYAIEEGEGPFAQLTKASPVSTAYASSVNKASTEPSSGSVDELKNEENEADEEQWESLHEFFANLTLLLVIVHICGVLLSSHLEQVNLVKAMITGRKETPENE